MAYNVISTTALIAKFKYALENKWGYIWGTAGVKWTQAKQDAINQTTDENRAQARQYGKKWIGHYVADCSGLFAWAFKSLGSYMYHGSNTMWNKYCVNKGTLVNGKRSDGQPLKPGTAVFVYNTKKDNRSHVGLYIGGGIVIEASSTYYGVTTSKITNSKWSEWGELKYVDYTASDTGEDEVPAMTNPTLRRGDRGDDVKKAQQLLNDSGYSVGEIDGIFGSKTFAAVKNFQGSRGLKADGVIGPNTWAALESIASTGTVTYRVVIPHLSQITAEALKTAYPSALIEAE